MEKILIVEDEDLNALEYEERLKSFGYDVVGVSDKGEDAIEKVNILKPDLVLMDIKLQGKLDGIETAQEILKNYDIPIIFLSVYSDKEIINRAYEVNPAGYLLKPLTERELRITLDLALYKSHMEKKIAKLELDLKDSENNYSKIIESSQDIVFIVNKSGSIIFITEQVESILGYKRSSMFNTQFEEYVPQDELQNYYSKIEEVLGSGEVKNFITKIYNNNKHELDVVINAKTYKKGDQTLIQGSIRDISPFLKFEKKINDSFKSYEGLFNAISDSTIVISSEMNIIDLNKITLRLFEYKKNELIGQKFDMIFETDSIYKTNLKEAINSVFKTGTSISFDLIAKKKNNFTFPVEIVIDRSVYFGQNVIILTIHDMTQRIFYENDLEKKQHMFRSIYDASPALLCIINTDYQVIDANQKFKEVTGWPKNNQNINTIGNVIDCIYSVTNPHGCGYGLKCQECSLRQKLKNTIENRIEYKEVEYKHTIFHGVEEKEITVLISTHIIQFNGETNFLLNLIDITPRIQFENEIKRKNEELQKLNYEKDNLFSIISHDLRSPFQGFIGLTEILSNSIDSMPPLKLKEISKTIHISATNIFALLKNLFEWSLIQRNLYEINLEPLQIKKIISSAIDSFKSTASLKNITIINGIKRDVTILADKKMLNSIIVNLISNAIKFSFRGSSIFINLDENSKESIIISVTDFGIGMPEELMKNLFKIEEKVGRKGTEDEPTTGLGLILCKEFVEKMNGNIWVSSKYNYGTSFQFSLIKPQ